MYISSFQLKNYKGFLESSTLAFAPGFNLIVGPNNAGKTALLEALSVGFTNKPHRSLTTVPTSSSKPNQVSSANLSFTLSGEELREMFRTPGQSIFIPMAKPDSDVAQSMGDVNSESGHEYLKNHLLSQSELTFHLRFQNNQMYSPKFPSLDLYEPHGVDGTAGEFWFVRFTIREDGTTTSQYVRSAKNSDFGLTVAEMGRSRIYNFQAERFNVGESDFGRNEILAPNAQNLPEVLSDLQSNIARFERFNALVREILSNVQHVSVHAHPSQNNRLEILIWNHNPESEREDLAIPLSESGTGVGQVLAILYVVLTSDFSRTIIIDEPQSFLHPGAVRKLIEILKRYPQHQFIISTHSPTVIASAYPTTITLIKQEGTESVCELLDASQVDEQSKCLAEIGARPSDVFGADNILWVEGQTEEECFPLILEEIVKHPLMGTIIRGVKQTGDLEGRRARLVFDIYDRLSQSGSLLPPAIGFLFDSETRTEEEKEELRRRSTNPVDFLPRRMYENYLLHPAAIAHVTSELKDFRPESVAEADVTALIQQKQGDSKYFDPLEVGNGEDWITRIHGALILDDIFKELSEQRYCYEKTTHAVALTEWLIENSPEELDEVVKSIKKILDNSDESAAS